MASGTVEGSDCWYSYPTSAYNYSYTLTPPINSGYFYVSWGSVADPDMEMDIGL